jgi:autotransporter-associated beta strand protein
VLDAGGGTAIQNTAGNGSFGLQSQLASDGTVVVAAGQLAITAGLDTNGHHLGVEIASGAAGRIDGAITGAGGLQKLGSGTLTLDGTNTYSGGTTVTAGTLVETARQSIPDGSLTIGAGGTFIFDPTAAAGPNATSPPAAAGPIAASPPAMAVASAASPPTLAVASAAFPRSAAEILLPAHTTLPTLLPPPPRKASQTPAMAAGPPPESAGASLPATATLPPAAADAVLAVGLSLPIPQATSFRAAAAAVTATPSDPRKGKAASDAVLLTRMTAVK